MGAEQMTENERIVRDAWENVHEYRSLCRANMVQFGSHSLPNFAAARAFTEQRIEECRQLREEIDVHREELCIHKRSCRRDDEVCDYARPMKRTLARLESILTDKQRGMRERP